MSIQPLNIELPFAGGLQIHKNIPAPKPEYRDLWPSFLRVSGAARGVSDLLNIIKNSFSLLGEFGSSQASLVAEKVSTAHSILGVFRLPKALSESKKSIQTFWEGSPNPVQKERLFTEMVDATVDAVSSVKAASSRSAENWFSPLSAPDSTQCTSILRPLARRCIRQVKYCQA